MLENIIQAVSDISAGEAFGTAIFLIVLYFASVMWYKLTNKVPKVNIYGEVDPKEKVDVIVPTIDHELVMERTSNLVGCKHVNKILIATPNFFKETGKYVNIIDEGTGRSDAVNKALDYVESEKVMVLDEDMVVPNTTIKKGILALNDYDVVKLTALPRLAKEKLSLFKRFVRIERLANETNLHPKSTPHWGGTGFIRTKVIKELGFRNEMLTEDIDFTIRAYDNNYKVGSFDSMDSYEDYPNFRGWVTQRRRWAAGWFQAFWKNWRSLRKQKPLRILHGQVFALLPFIMIVGAFFGNIFKPLTALVLSIYALLPFFVIGLKYDRKVGILYPVYALFNILFNAVSCIFPPRKYYITPKE